jgi:7-cyano-7-deazaguanine synthase in queuosine biosynthesis
MTAAPRVLVLCNGAPRSEDQGEYKSVLTLAYHSNAPAKRNIELALPNFIRGVYHLPDRLLDLLEIAAYVFSADRLIRRGEHDAVEYHAWARSVEFRIRVRDYEFWSQDDVKHKLSEALTFMTGDRDFTFIFQSGHRTPATSLFDRGDFRIEPRQRTSIVLFSGGLDSLAGAIERLETSNDHVCLVSHRSQPGTIRTQDGLVQALEKQPHYKSRISHYPFLCRLTGIRAPEESQRTRAFLYTSIAFALCRALSQDEFFVFENGVTSLNFSRREDLANARASRTTHPRTLALLQSVFSEIAGRPIRINAPFVWHTKEDVFRKIRSFGQELLIPSTVSCSRTFQNLGNATHCGTCFQCIDRRLAAYASDCDDIDGLGIYAQDFVTANLDGEARTTLVDYIRQARDFAMWNVDHFYNEMLNGLVEVVDHLPGISDEFEAVEALWKVCCRHGDGIERALRVIRERHDHPFADVPPDSLLQLVARREYLKEPVQRLIEALVPRLSIAIPQMFAKGRLPKDEADLNQKMRTLLDGWRDDLVSEHPTVEFAEARVIPDHALTKTDLLIEAKYIRGGTTPSKASEGITADLTKYPQRKHTLFIVYDPFTAILDPYKFERDFESRGKCTVRVIR